MGEGQGTHGHHQRDQSEGHTLKQKQDLANQILTLTLLKLFLVFHSLLISLDKVVKKQASDLTGQKVVMTEV